MFRGTLVAFVLGWVIWLWIDKNPATLGPLPYPQDGEFLRNFQTTIDLIKQTRFKAAFIYIWNAHYLALSLALGLLLGMLGNALANARSRRRFIKLYVPDKNRTEEDQH